MLKLSSGIFVFVATAAVWCSPGWSQAPTTILTPGPEAYPDNRFDKSDELKITGEVEKVETLSAGTIVWMRAKTIERQGFGTRPGDDEKGAGFLWRVEGAGLTKLKDMAKLVAGAKIVVVGDNASDKRCEPTCRISSDKVTLK